MDIGIQTKFPKEIGFEKIEETVINILSEYDFGILTEIDVKKTLKKKLDIDTDKYKILGACNPPRAHKAIEEEPEIGILLPCNVIIYEKDESIIVSAAKPTTLFTLVENEELEPIAQEVDEIMQKVIEEAKNQLLN